MKKYILLLVACFFLPNICKEPLLKVPELDDTEPKTTPRQNTTEHHQQHIMAMQYEHDQDLDQLLDPSTDDEINSDELDLLLGRGKPKTDSMTSTDTMQVIRKKLEMLPEHNRPQSITVALHEIQQGKQAFEKVAQGKFYDAVAQQNPAYKDYVDAQTLQRAFNTTDQEFWQIAQHNKLLQEKAKKHKIPFTLEDFCKPENNMYLRATYARKNMIDQALMNKFIHDYKQRIVQIQWHLYAHSIINDIAFTSGMITMHDPNHQLFKFLDGYCELVNPKYKLHDGKSIKALISTKAYSRESSHWTGQRALGGKNFGIDFMDNRNNPDHVLPGNKSHLLFGMRDNGMVFVKWEEYGVTFNPMQGDISAIPHLFRYFQKNGVHSDDESLHRREKIPPTVKKEFEKLYPGKLNQKIMQDIDTYGISYMRQILHNQYPDREIIFDHFLVTHMHYDPTTLHVRKGSEVIL